MKKFILYLLFLLPLFAFAQDANWSKASANGYEYQFVPNDKMNTRFYTLKNGLTVILTVNKETPRIQTIIATKAGSKTDPHDHTGLAHYLEHMLFKGTDKFGSLDWKSEKKYLDMIDELYEQYNSTTDEKKRTSIYRKIDSVSGIASKYAIANEYDKMMSMIGAKGTNAFTSFEQTAYINDIPSNQIDRWLAVEAERFRNPVLRIFHTELEAVYEEKNRGLDADDNKVFEMLFEKLFKNHNYGLQTTIGTIEHLKNPSLKEIRNYFYKNYVPNNMCVIMAGDFDPDQLIAKIDKSFSYMKPKPVPAYTFKPEPEITSPIEGTVYGPDAEYVDLAFRFPGASSKEAMLLNLMSSILSNGNAGLMDLNLVKKQTVLEASAGAYTLKDYSVLFMEGKAKEGQKLEEVRALMLGQIELLKSGNFDQGLITAIVNNYRKSLIQQRENNGGRAFGLLESFTSEVGWDKTVAQLDEMSKITKADIQAFTKKWLNNNYVCIYKRIGKDENVKKVDKPAITPVSVNRDAQSDFVKSVANMKAEPVAPVFVNYDKDIERATVTTSTNNVPLLRVPNTTNPLFTQYYYIETGSLHNKLFPIAMDYLQYLGTDKYSADEISQMFYSLACDFGVSAGEEESYVYLSGLQDNYLKALMLFEELLANCQPNEEALKEMIAGEKKKRSDAKLNKNMIRSGLRYYAQYGPYNPFNNELSNDELDKIQPKDLIDILHSLTSYNHKVLYYGPESANEITRILGRMHTLPAKFTPTPEAKPYTFNQTASNEVLFADYDMVQAEIQWFRNGDVYNPEVVPTISMFNEYFGGNMSGIVFQEIRESKALAYSTYAAYATPQKKGDPFSVSAYVGCQADKMKEAIAGMQELLTNLPESEKLFTQSKAGIRNTISTTRTTKTGILFSYLNAQKKGINYDMNEKLYKQVDAFSFADIQNFYKKNISGKPYTLTVVGSDAKMNWTELKKFGPVKKLSLEEIFGY
ncbi:MAG: insulinase family protein [Chitinophagaceae bacterium]|nr:insulinase family protein [Chitinophagaceae bacterium]